MLAVSSRPESSLEQKKKWRWKEQQLGGGALRKRFKEVNDLVGKLENTCFLENPPQQLSLGRSFFVLGQV